MLRIDIMEELKKMRGSGGSTVFLSEEVERRIAHLERLEESLKVKQERLDKDAKNLTELTYQKFYQMLQALFTGKD